MRSPPTERRSCSKCMRWARKSTSAKLTQTGDWPGSFESRSRHSSATARRSAGILPVRRGLSREAWSSESWWSRTGATAKDIPWLKLDAVNKQGDGPLKDVTTVQRINTVGGSFDGGCEKTGDLHAEPYAADYVFLKRASQ